MLRFNRNGYIEPAEIVELNLKDLESYFANNSVRKVIFEEYLLYLSDIKSLLSEHFFQWVDGSYTTNKPLPFDLDLVTFVHYKDYFINILNFKKIEKKYPHVDAHIAVHFEAKHKRSFETQLEKQYWQDVFGSDRFKRPKGFLQINF
jgi:hypothetical protein